MLEINTYQLPGQLSQVKSKNFWPSSNTTVQLSKVEITADIQYVTIM